LRARFCQSKVGAGRFFCLYRVPAALLRGPTLDVDEVLGNHRGPAQQSWLDVGLFISN
jgi:hypothetical protein